MEKLKSKHDHKGTKALQLVLFFIVMLAPFIAVGVKCGYTMLNPNAKDSYYGTHENEINYKEVNNLSDFQLNKEYIYTGLSIDTNNTNYARVRTTIYVSNLTYNGIDYDNCSISFYSSGNWLGIYLYEIENDEFILSGSDAKNVSFTFTYLNNNFTDNYAYISAFFKLINYSNISYIDNVFYYATNQLNEEPLFNWTQQTAIYSTLNLMLSGFDIGTGTATLCLLLSYWALMSAIYIVFDIIIFIFTKLTHMIQ